MLVASRRAFGQLLPQLEALLERQRFTRFHHYSAVGNTTAANQAAVHCTYDLGALHI